MAQESMFHQLSQHGPISLVEVDVAGHEWEVLGQLLDSGILTNVSQVTQILVDLYTR